MVRLNIRRTAHDHPDAIGLNDRLQLEYARRYGDGDEDVEPLDPLMFEPPNGLYLVAYDEQDRPVAGGGWRAHKQNDEGCFNGDAEVKRMYVVPEARRLGLARRILAALEDSAWAAGRNRIVLVTGTEQPEATAPYIASGYTPHTKFGHYGNYRDARFFAKLRRSGS